VPLSAASSIAERPPLPTPPALPAEVRPDGRKVGMIAFFCSESAFFSTLILTYVIFLGNNVVGPTPEIFSMRLAIVNTICLLSSSVTIHFAERALRAGNRAGFLALWLLTILLGAAFIAGTGFEWYDLIVNHHLTIGRNMFGTTYFTLVGFHAGHVTVGLLLLSLMFGLVLRGAIRGPKSIGVELVSWYWHFVDGVWIVVFTVVYLIGR
jgi:cytochrome c oxidase subunit III